jgi:drug/metabolite transporter (DMT)-like permease
MDIAWIWIPVTILAAAFQVGRNVIQRRLVEELGTIGATQVRFLYGLPFAILLALGTLWITGADIPHMNMDFLIFIFSGSSTQIIATAKYATDFVAYFQKTINCATAKRASDFVTRLRKI